jgi:hypothetical protein
MDDNTLPLRAVLRQGWESSNTLTAELERQGKGTPVATGGSLWRDSHVDPGIGSILVVTGPQRFD